MKNKILHTLMMTPISRGRWGVPALLWGPPGAAKSAAVDAYGAKYGLPVEVLSPGQRGEGAFGVTPVPEKNAEGKTVMTYPAPDWVAKFERAGGRGILFLDEFNLAAPVIQAAMLGIVLDRVIGTYFLPGAVRVIGAANPVEISAGGWDLPAPSANRLTHVDWPGPDSEEWGDWLLSGAATDGETATFNAVDEEKRVLEAWPEAFARARGLFSAFIRRRPELLHKMPKPGDAMLSRAWPSPRSHEMAARLLASATIQKLSESETDELLSSTIGAGATSEFATWRTEQDLPDPVEILDGKVPFAHDPDRLDRTMAVLSSCAAFLTTKTAQGIEDRRDRFWSILGTLTDDCADIIVVPAKALVQAKLHKNSKAADAVMAKLQPVLWAAGIRGN